MATGRAELEKLTAPKLCELALEKYPNITGVSGMKKEELIEAILTEEVKLGLRPKKEEERQATGPMGATQLKAAIRALKKTRDAALQGKDREGLATVRLQVKRMKRRLRKLREAS
ncbi:MAG: Rho termination factor N-terminal domain-containing protein [candidate division NC10 bacterium]